MRNQAVRSLLLMLMVVGCEVEPDDGIELFGGSNSETDMGDASAPDAVLDLGRPADQGAVDRGIADQSIDLDQRVADQGVDPDQAVGSDQGVADQAVDPDQTVANLDQGLPDGSGCVPVDEVCDAIDNDCDGLIDEGTLNRCGECGFTDVCDGIDNDCDGRTDENGAGGACEADALGQCAVGVQQCTRGVVSCRPSPRDRETCNQRDDDCDGQVDEGFRVDVERCDSRDNDCDGRVDEGLQLGEACDLPGCGAGLFQCASDRRVECSSIARRQPEQCDGLDDDCDGEIDEDLDRFPEWCDGVDDDCDGQIDEGAQGAGVDCAIGFGACRVPVAVECVAGALRCDADMGELGPEAFNNLDDDCDGRVDEGFLGAPCDVGCGQGLLGCPGGLAECDALVCLAPAEMCADGLDNDCDDATDEQQGVRHLPPGYTDAIVHDETLIAWGGARIGRFTLDGRALQVAELAGLGDIRVVAPAPNGFGVFGRLDRGNHPFLPPARALTFVQLDVQLRPETVPTMWLQTRAYCDNNETTVLEATPVPGGYLAFYAAPCAQPEQSLTVQALDETGQPLGQPRILREAACEWPGFAFGVCAVTARRVADRVFVSTRGVWPDNQTDRDLGPPTLLTLDTDGALLDANPLSFDAGQDYEWEWGTAFEVVSGAPLTAIAKSLQFGHCNSIPGWVAVQGAAGEPLLLDTARPHPRQAFAQPGVKQIFTSVSGPSLLTVWSSAGTVSVAAVEPNPLRITTPASVVTTLHADELLIGTGSLPDGRLTLVTSLNDRIGAKVVGWPACRGEDQDCDGVVDEGCPNDACRAGSDWYRPGGYWHVLAGDDPRPQPLSIEPGVSQAFDECGRVTWSLDIDQWQLSPFPPNGNCQRLRDTVSTETTNGYDAGGNLIDVEFAFVNVHGDAIYHRNIAHTHDGIGPRIETRAWYDCDDERQEFDCEILNPLGLRVIYTNDDRGRLVREEVDLYPALDDREPDGVDRISTFTWDDEAGIVIEDIDHDANGEPDERLVHPIR